MNLQLIIDETKSDLQFQLNALLNLGKTPMTSTVRTQIILEQMNTIMEQINYLQAKIETLEELK